MLYFKRTSFFLDYWRMNNGYKTTLVYNHRMIDFWLLVAKSIYALLLTQNVGVNILSVFQNIDDLELEECCRSIKRLAVPLVGRGAAGTGDKVRTFTGLSLCSMSRNCP